MSNSSHKNFPARHESDAYFADQAAQTMLLGRLDELSHPDERNWEIVKHNPSRTVWRGRIDGQLVYLKHFHPRSIWRLMLAKLTGSRALREMRFSRLLEQAGVHATPVLAAKCGKTREWVASAAIEPAMPADVWQTQKLASGTPADKRAVRQAMLRVAEIIGRMHAAGIVHQDLHAGNILIRTNTPEPEPVLTDLHRIHRRHHLSRRVRAQNLGQLLHDRQQFTTRSERLRFLKHYLAASGCGGAMRGWDHLIIRLARQHTAHQRSKLMRRILRANRYFAPVRFGRGWRGHVMLAFKQPPSWSAAGRLTCTAKDWRKTLAHPEELLQDGPDVQVLKDSRTSRVVRRDIDVGGHVVNVVIKRTQRRQAWKILVDCFRRARSIRAFHLAHSLLVHGIPTALPLAALERRRGPFLLNSLLIAETVDAPTLDRFLEVHLTPSATEPVTNALDDEQRRQLAQDVLWELGGLVHRLHDNGFSHRDLKSSNLLVRGQPPDPPAVVLVDLDGLRRLKRISQRRRFKGLMRLNVSLLKCPVVSHAGRLRMLLGYIRMAGLSQMTGRNNFKPYWRVIEEWSSQKLAQQIRSRRRQQRATRRPS